ncbi:MAG: class II aldolase/adducin family protein [Lachnospiraceae bacterium]|nr:class II aldolase/adducin family protein [Lachnospiraceae bacterium]
MNDKYDPEILEKICEIGRRMYNREMVAANDGNISVRLSDGAIVCTPTGVSKGFMKPEMLTIIDEKGNILRAAEGYKPSSEIKMHLRVYERRRDIQAVVHAHPPYATTFACMEKELEKPIMTEAVVSLGRVPLAPYATPSTKEVPDSIEGLVMDHNALLLSHHGALTYGESLEKAYMLMESVEFYARLLYQTETLGGAETIKGEALLKLKNLVY